MSLLEWQRNGWVTTHTSSPQEIRDLLAVVERDLHDSGARGLSADWRMNIAYNAALQAAALAAAGYRATRDQHHYRVIQSLRETINAEPAVLAAFDSFRKKRNISGYERVGLVSDADADEMHAIARGLRDDVVAWLETHHASLMSGGRGRPA